MKANNFVKSTLVTALLLSSLFGCAAQVTGPSGDGAAVSAATADNVRQFINPSLIAPLEHLPPQLELITRETVVETRALVGEMLKAKGTEGVTVKKTVIRSPEGDVPLYIYQPENQGQNKPAILWIHGGGYIMGNAETDFAGAFSKQLNATVVSVDYRLAPEHPFPAGINDSQTALLWMVEHAEALGIDTARIAVGGDSAGAGMAAGLVLKNRDENGPKIALQFLLYPMLDNLHATRSGAIEDYPVWSRQTSFNAWEMYLDGTPGVDASPYAAAARAKDVSGLPETFITIGAVDLFRDEVVDYAQRLMAAGVPTQLAVFPGMYHAGELFVPDASVSQKMVSTYVSALKQALED